MLPSPCGRGAGGEGETLHKSGFHVKLTPMGTVVPLQSVAFFFQIGMIPGLSKQFVQNRCTIKN
ncbi:hypothetical protein FDUTEX481_05282 [Tolypothrix sp. PCC 7601]|nr:hypothetical protein FDUTEX481_05282 [Tolypothrix sp. PCC 7601]